MYELVNTSAPNGLIAGTHGFATVAMTKGLPDAVRMRIENFCAYPHRTSAHDQSYWKENPVNWFHLTLPGGDHVVGRTAPAEFDYTGRTNRLSHVLYFPAKEMPLNGGAFILASEERRFSESWSGEPRYLNEDKTTSGRLRMADPMPKGEPSNWIRMFGPQGREYARRFAMLLANNITGAGKSIYFKASPSQDSDGTRIFGLFSDLINLLPDRLVPLATFSTFSACVPGGVTCHLRGIFDRNQAFEVASSLSPWVDCEACEVKHAELLPEMRSATVKSTAGSVSEPSHRVDVPYGRSSAGAQRSQGPFQIGIRATTKSKSDPFVIWMISLSVAIVIAVVCVACYTFWPKKSANAAMSDKPSFEEVREIEAENKRMTLEEEPKKREQAKKEEREKEEKQRRLEEDRKAIEAEEEKRKANEKEAEAAAQKLKSAAVEKQKKQEAEARTLLEKPLKDLPNLETVPNGKNWDDKLNDEDKEKLCKPNSLEFFFLVNGEVKKTAGHLKENVSTNLMTRKQKVSYQAASPEPKSSPWLVVHIPSMNKTYWQWNERDEGVALFDGQDEVDLSEIAFGGVREACELFSRHGRVIYVISWRADGLYGLYRTDACLNIDRFMPKEADHKRAANSIKRLDHEIENLNSEIAELSNKTNNAEKTWYSEMLECISKYADLERRLKESNKIADNDKVKNKDKEKAEIKDKQKKLREEALSCFTNFPTWKSKKEISLSDVKTSDCDRALKQYKEKIGEEIQKKREKLKGKRCERASKEKASLDWKVEVKKREYKIAVITELPEDVVNKLGRNAVERYHNLGEVDYIRKPTGVNGN